ncbi:acyltransferase family protein [Alteromonas sp. H39]|uniref:acyltransferase family protein n=1 Tax=Alteromonas sp. H39 TaxID=3389876 RepID=UPI0039E0FA64
MNQGDFVKEQQKERFHALDNLRVLAFGVLILYHIGMFYVLDWGWHIKSDTQFGWLQDVMLLTNQWRMSLLFLISAMVLGVLLKRYPQWTVVRERTRRLLIPLLFGMVVIVAPQVFIEGTVNEIFDVSFFQFYGQYVNPVTTWLPEHQSAIGLLTWNHLWFLPYLFCYSIIIAICYPLLARLASAWPASLDKPHFFMTLIIGLTMVVWLALRQDYPTTHDLVNDWYSHAKYFLVMLTGFIIVSRPVIWSQLMTHRRVLLIVAMVMYAVIIAYRHDAFGSLSEDEQNSPRFLLIVATVVVTNHWCWLGAILGYGKKYLHYRGALTRYLNTAILPYYLLHQTLIVVCAYWLMPLALPVWIEFALILSFTALGCAAGYELVRRVSWLRPCFGLRQKASGQASQIDRAETVKAIAKGENSA